MLIGREKERQQAITILFQHGVLWLHGPPLVGKSSLALQIGEDVRDKCRAQGHTCTVKTLLCNEATSWSELRKIICQELSLDDDLTDEQLERFIKELKQSPTATHVLLLLLKLNGLSTTGNDAKTLARFIRHLATAGVSIIATSRHKLKIHLPRQLEPPQISVSPMTLNEMSELLHQAAPDVRVEEFRDLMRDYCRGLPRLVLEMAELLKGPLAFSVSELIQELLDHPELLLEGLEDEAREVFSNISLEYHEELKRLASLLGEGHFTTEQMQAALGQDERKVKMLARRLHDDGSLILDEAEGRLCLEPLVLFHIRKIGDLSVDDQARQRVVTMLGQVLTRAERDYYLKGQDTVYGHVQGEWPQLRQVFKQAIHCTENTYMAFFQVATQADRLLVKCFPREALIFYEDLAVAARSYGTPYQQALLHHRIGMAHSVGVGTGWEKALEYFHLALPELKRQPRSLDYLCLLCDLGFTLYRLNKYQESEKYLREAVSLFSEETIEDDPKLIHHMIRARYMLSVPVLFEGHFQEAKQLVKDTLALIEEIAPYHPVKPLLINSLGLVFERSGTDQNLALLYYKNSLAERRTYQGIAPTELVACLNNIAMQHLRRDDFISALGYLEECLTIRLKENRWHFGTGLTYQHIGHVHLKMGDYRTAADNLQSAAEIYERCTSKHESWCKVKLSLAHVHLMLEEFDETKRHLKDVCDFARDVELSDDGLAVLMSAIEHRAQLEGLTAQKMKALLLWGQELLSNFHGDINEKIQKHKDTITLMSNTSNNDDVSQVESVLLSLTSQISDVCQECCTCKNGDSRLTLWEQVVRQATQTRAALQMLQMPPLRHENVHSMDIQESVSSSADSGQSTEGSALHLDNADGGALQQNVSSSLPQQQDEVLCRNDYAASDIGSAVCEPRHDQSLLDARELHDNILGAFNNLRDPVMRSSENSEKPSVTAFSDHYALTEERPLAQIPVVSHERIAEANQNFVFTLLHDTFCPAFEHSWGRNSANGSADPFAGEVGTHFHSKYKRESHIPLARQFSNTTFSSNTISTYVSTIENETRGEYNSALSSPEPAEHWSLNPMIPVQETGSSSERPAVLRASLITERVFLSSSSDIESLYSEQLFGSGDRRTQSRLPNSCSFRQSEVIPILDQQALSINNEEGLASGQRTISLHRDRQLYPMTFRMGSCDISLNRQSGSIIVDDQARELACLQGRSDCRRKAPAAHLQNSPDEGFHHSQIRFSQSQNAGKQNWQGFLEVGQPRQGNRVTQSVFYAMREGGSGFHSIHPRTRQPEVVQQAAGAAQENQQLLAFSELCFENQVLEQRLIRNNRPVPEPGHPENLRRSLFEVQEEHGPVSIASGNESTIDPKQLRVWGEDADAQSLASLDLQLSSLLDHHSNPASCHLPSRQTGRDFDAESRLSPSSSASSREV